MTRALPAENPVRVDRERWAGGLPADVWPESLPDGLVLRADVFDVAEAWRAGQVSTRTLTAAALAWGHGPSNVGVHRASEVLAADPQGRRLDLALAPLRADAPTEDDLRRAYVAFRTDAKVKGLGASFFTKLLYFAGYRRGVGGVQPLILDKIVALRLPPEVGITSKVFYWRSAEWMSYLRWAADQGDEPDHVEVRIFNA